MLKPLVPAITLVFQRPHSGLRHGYKHYMQLTMYGNQVDHHPSRNREYRLCGVGLNDASALVPRTRAALYPWPDKKAGSA